MNKFQLLFYFSIFVFCSCSKSDESDSRFNIEKRNGLWYDTKTNQLYTGGFLDTLLVNVEGSFVNGKRDGYWKHVHLLSKKVVSEGMYKDGQKHSTWIKRWSNGNLFRSMKYDNGLPVGEWYEMNENGKRRMGYCLFVNGDGFWRRSYENGQQSEIGYFSNGLKTGEWNYYYENGNLKIEGTYHEGNRVGDWKFYSKDESLRLKFSSSEIDSIVNTKNIEYLSSIDVETRTFFQLVDLPTHFKDVGDFDHELLFIGNSVGETF